MLYKNTRNQMPGQAHISEAVEQTIKRDGEKLVAVNAELKALHTGYLKYKELLGERALLEERLQVNVAVMGEHASLETGTLVENLVATEGLTLIDDVDEDRKAVPLWKIIREIIKHTEKIRIVDLETQLVLYGFEVTRQAIESAIRTHRPVFRESKRGREKFVSLK